jgi:hypothetical protein
MWAGVAWVLTVGAILGIAWAVLWVMDYFDRGPFDG